ncbi:MAG TPA: GIY-YIG nuclease family protein [Tissierellia bacterium]|nr:GIY-YIG nuclease family protein [Tissierellia bacterium]
MNAALDRVNQYTRTAGLDKDVLYATVAIDSNGNSFFDTDIHEMLDRSGFNRPDLFGAKEWYEIDLQTAIEAITLFKSGSRNIYPVAKRTPDIVFRPEQRKAIDKTIGRFADRRGTIKKGRSFFMER